MGLQVKYSLLKYINHWLDKISEFLAQRRGLLPFIGIIFILLNGILQFVSATSWLAETNLLLHIGIILAILGVLLAWSL
jgi:hypothetical protein